MARIKLTNEENDLGKRIEQRKQEAEEKDIDRKLYWIYKYLGMKPSKNFELEKYGSGWISGDGDTILTYKSKVVFAENDNKVSAFAPGVWEEEFNRLYKKARAINDRETKEEETRRRNEQRKAVQKLKNAFGL